MLQLHYEILDLDVYGLSISLTRRENKFPEPGSESNTSKGRLCIAQRCVYVLGRLQEVRLKNTCLW